MLVNCAVTKYDHQEAPSFNMFTLTTYYTAVSM